MDIQKVLIEIKHQATRSRNKPRSKKDLLVDLEIISKHVDEALSKAEKLATNGRRLAVSGEYNALHNHPNSTKQA